MGLADWSTNDNEYVKSFPSDLCRVINNGIGYQEYRFRQTIEMKPWNELS